MQPLEVVWHKFETLGRDHSWFRFLLSELETEESFVDAFESTKPHTLHVINTNHDPLSSLPTDFLELVRKTPGVGLFHASDEWFGEDYSIYSSFQYVIRTYWARSIAKWDGTLTVPLGPPLGPAEATAPVKPASQREYAWSFAGAPKGSRGTMLRAMRTVKPNIVRGTGLGTSAARLTIKEYYQLLSESAFCPAPMGNVMAEARRIYEGLEVGCVPLVERRLFMRYYDGLFGKHPIPTFLSWRDAAKFAGALMEDRRTLDDLQSEVYDWWVGLKRSLPSLVGRFIASREEGTHVSVGGPAASSNSYVRKAWQYGELARHHNVEAAFLRARRLVLIPRAAR